MFGIILSVLCPQASQALDVFLAGANMRRISADEAEEGASYPNPKYGHLGFSFIHCWLLKEHNGQCDLSASRNRDVSLRLGSDNDDKTRDGMLDWDWGLHFGGEEG